MIDSHCHPETRDELIAARDTGLAGLVAIAAPDFARAHQNIPGLRVWTTLGVHPHDAATGELPTAETTANPLVIAIGEIGLDYHYDHSPRPVQLDVFERQIALANTCGLPVSIHCRDAWDDCFSALHRQPVNAGGVFHCFTGDLATARTALDLGWYLSFSGMLTFPKSSALREVAAWAPADRILVETDAPYLAPVPHRGKPNQPAWVTLTAAALAALRQLPLANLDALTTANFFRLFPRAC